MGLKMENLENVIKNRKLKKLQNILCRN